MGQGQRSETRFPPVHNPFTVQVLQAATDLSWIKDGSGLIEACVTHVIDVELEVAPIHEGQNETQRLLRLIGIGQTHLHMEERVASILAQSRLTLVTVTTGSVEETTGSLRQICCWPSPRSASRSTPWTRLSASWSSSSQAFCRRTSSQSLGPDTRTPEEGRKVGLFVRVRKLFSKPFFHINTKKLTHLTEASFPQNSVLSKCVLCHRLSDDHK